MNSQKDEQRPKLRSDGFIQFSHVQKMKSLKKKLGSVEWNAYFRHRKMSEEDELCEATLMASRTSFEDEETMLRVELGFEETHIPPQWWNHLFIRAKQGHKDNDPNEQDLIRFLDFRA